jgi:hypothetical protein
MESMDVEGKKTMRKTQRLRRERIEKNVVVFGDSPIKQLLTGQGGCAE